MKSCAECSVGTKLLIPPGKPVPEGMYRTTQLAKACGVTTRTITTWGKRGFIPDYDPPGELGYQNVWTQAQLDRAVEIAEALGVLERIGFGNLPHRGPKGPQR